MDEDGHESSMACMPQLVCGGLESSDSASKKENKLYKNEFSEKDPQKEW
jgi:hypothetical protein